MAVSVSDCELKSWDERTSKLEAYFLQSMQMKLPGLSFGSQSTLRANSKITLLPVLLLTKYDT